MNNMKIDYGVKYWYNEQGEYHRTDGPAVEHWDGTKYWYQNGKLHREDGPAIMYRNGENQYWHEGKNYSKIENDHQWMRLVKMMIFS